MPHRSTYRHKSSTCYVLKVGFKIFTCPLKTFVFFKTSQIAVCFARRPLERHLLEIRIRKLNSTGSCLNSVDVYINPYTNINKLSS